TNQAMGGASSTVVAPTPTGTDDQTPSAQSAAPRVLPDPTCDRFTRVAATMFRVPWSLLATVEPDGIVVRSLAGPAGIEVPWDADLAHAPLTCAPGDVSWTEDASTDPRFSRHESVTGQFGMRFYAAVPIRSVGGQPVGLLAVFDIKSRQMSIDEQQALQDLALSAAEFFKIRERARTGPVSLVNNTPDARFVKALVRHSSEIFTMLTTEGIVSFASGAHAKTIGYEAEDLVGHNVFDYVHEEDRPRVMEAFRRVLSETGVTQTVEYR